MIHKKLMNCLPGLCHHFQNNTPKVFGGYSLSHRQCRRYLHQPGSWSADSQIPSDNQCKHIHKSACRSSFPQWKNPANCDFIIDPVFHPDHKLLGIVKRSISINLPRNCLACKFIHSRVIFMPGMTTHPFPGDDMFG